MNSGINGYQTMPLEKSGIDLPPFPYGLYGAKPKDVQGRTKTKADCKSGKYINIHTGCIILNWSNLNGSEG